MFLGRVLRLKGYSPRLALRSSFNASVTRLPTYSTQVQLDPMTGEATSLPDIQVHSHQHSSPLLFPNLFLSLDAFKSLEMKSLPLHLPRER